MTGCSEYIKNVLYRFKHCKYQKEVCLFLTFSLRRNTSKVNIQRAAENRVQKSKFAIKTVN